MKIPFIDSLIERVASRPKEWREGQAYFNYLREDLPLIGEIVRGTDKDPFHNDEAIPKLLQYLESLSIQPPNSDN